jgi:S1-C subfamily serine protease
MPSLPARPYACLRGPGAAGLALRFPLAFTLACALGVALGMPASGACAQSAPVLATSAPQPPAARQYGRLLLLLPRDDPRKLGPRAAAAFESMGLQVRVIENGAPLDTGEGSGLLVSAAGYVLTCAHVLDQGATATVTIDGARLTADVVRADAADDIALLKLRTAPPAGTAVARLRRATRGYGAGEEAFAIGYPAGRDAAGDKRVTRGLLQAAGGPQDDGRHFKILARIDPGSSGGPLLDREGLVIGIVQQTINPWRSAPVPGGAPPPAAENSALRVEALLDFVRAASPDAYRSLEYDNSPGVEGTGAAVVRVESGAADPGRAAGRRMVVRLDYYSRFELWYRFTFLALAAFDYQTEEPLFTIVPSRDTLVGNEDLVLKDAFDQFHDALRSR